MMQCLSGRVFSRADLKSLNTPCAISFTLTISIPSILHLAAMSGTKAYWVNSTFSSLSCWCLWSLMASAIQPTIWFELSVLATRKSHTGWLQRRVIILSMQSMREGRECVSWIVSSCLYASW